MSRDYKTCLVCGARQRFRFTYRAYRYYRCGACELVSTFPLPDEDMLERHYSQKYADGNYQLLREYANDYISVYRNFVAVLDSRLQECRLRIERAKVLDIGCFTGDFLGLLADRGAEVYGVELQREAVAIANRRFPGRVFRADVCRDALPKTGFTAVTLLGVLEHMVSPPVALRRATDALERGGVLMVQTPDSSSAFAKLMGRWWPPYCPVEHVHLFGRKSLRLLFERLGFVDVRFTLHWKRLPIGYVYHMLENFGPEFRAVLRPLYVLTPRFLRKRALPFTVGEMIATARKA